MDYSYETSIYKEIVINNTVLIGVNLLLINHLRQRQDLE